MKLWQKTYLLSTLLCFFYIRKRRPFLTIGRDDMKMCSTLAHQTASYAAVAALQQSSLYLGKLIIQSAVNGISLVSTAPISAFAAATRIENFTQAFGSSGCEAISIFVAQNRGAQQETRTYQGFARGFTAVVSIGILFSLAMHFGARPLSVLFLGADEESVALCMSYLQLISWFYVLSFTGHSFVGWFRGNGRMNITFWGTTIQIAIRVVGTYLLVSAMGLDAVALATGLGWVIIVFFHACMFYLGKKGIYPRKKVE